MICMQTKEANGSPADGLSGKSRAELVAETESLHQTNKMLTDQIRSLQVSQGLTLLQSVYSCLHRLWLKRLCQSEQGLTLFLQWQAKADEARQTVEIVSAENAQLGAHVQLLESELETLQAGTFGQQTGSNENSPRGTTGPSSPFEEAHEVTPQAVQVPQAQHVGSLSLLMQARTFQL